MRNHTPVTEFLLPGIPHTQGLEHVLFVFFLTFYLLTLVGNLLILLATLTSSNLHTPMYFFLGNLSVFDIFFPSVSSPKMMLYLLGKAGPSLTRAAPASSSFITSWAARSVSCIL